MSENKDNFEIVGFYKLSDKALETKKRTALKNGGQSVITKRDNLKGQQPNSALQESDSSNYIPQSEGKITSNQENVTNINENTDTTLNQLKNTPKQEKVHRGAFDVSAKAIELFKDADYSTLPHELAHYWLDNMWSK